MVSTVSALSKSSWNPSTNNNDADTVNEYSGLIWVYKYDEDNRLIATLIKEGESGTAYYYSFIEYLEGSNLAYRLHAFPTRVADNETTYPPTGGLVTEYAYTFWDTGNTRVRQRTIMPPVVDTDQNGSGQQTYLYEYFDESGRLRWTKNGEGYVTYRAYSPTSGSLAFQMRDVDTSNLGTEITTGDNSGPDSTDVKWDAWSDPDSGTSVPGDLARVSGLPSALKYVTKNEYDELGRIVRRIYPDLDSTYLVYEKYKTITFRSVDSSGLPAEPVIVTKWDDFHRNTDVYTVDRAKTIHPSTVPIGVNDADQDSYVSWSHNTYDAVSGALHSGRRVP